MTDHLKDALMEAATKMAGEAAREDRTAFERAAAARAAVELTEAWGLVRHREMQAEQLGKGRPLGEAPLDQQPTAVHRRG